MLLSPSSSLLQPHLLPTNTNSLNRPRGAGLGCPGQHTFQSHQTTPLGGALVKGREGTCHVFWGSVFPPCLCPPASPLPHVVMFLDVNFMEHHILLFGIDVCFHLHGNVTGKDRQQESLLGREADAFITAPPPAWQSPPLPRLHSSPPEPPPTGPWKTFQALRKLMELTLVCAGCGVMPQGYLAPISLRQLLVLPRTWGKVLLVNL